MGGNIGTKAVARADAEATRFSWSAPADERSHPGLFDAPHTNARRSKLKSKNAACLAAKGKPDVEQIGVYETVMGFTVEARPGPALAIRAGKNDRTPVFVDVAALAATKGGDEGSGTDEVPQGGG